MAERNNKQETSKINYILHVFWRTRPRTLSFLSGLSIRLSSDSGCLATRSFLIEHSQSLQWQRQIGRTAGKQNPIQIGSSSQLQCGDVVIFTLEFCSLFQRFSLVAFLCSTDCGAPPNPKPQAQSPVSVAQWQKLLLCLFALRLLHLSGAAAGMGAWEGPLWWNPHQTHRKI